MVDICCVRLDFVVVDILMMMRCCCYVDLLLFDYPYLLFIILFCGGMYICI